MIMGIYYSLRPGPLNDDINDDVVYYAHGYVKYDESE